MAADCSTQPMQHMKTLIVRTSVIMLLISVFDSYLYENSYCLYANVMDLR